MGSKLRAQNSKVALVAVFTAIRPMSRYSREKGPSSRSHRSMVLWFDRSDGNGKSGDCGLCAASRAQTCDDSSLHALKVARKLHRVFLTYIFLGSLNGGPTPGPGPVQCPRGEGNGHDTPEQFSDFENKQASMPTEHLD